MSSNFVTPKDLLRITNEAIRNRIYLPMLEKCYKEMASMAVIGNHKASLHTIIVTVDDISIKKQIIDHFVQAGFQLDYDLAINKIIVHWNNADQVSTEKKNQVK